MNAHLDHGPSARRSLLRPVAVLGATVAGLAATAGPALAVPPREPIVPPPGGGTDSFPVPAPATISEGLSTLQVVAISLLVSLAVALVMVGLAYLMRRHGQAGHRAVTLPAQRTASPTASQKEPAPTAR